MAQSRLAILETKVDDFALGQRQLRTEVDDLRATVATQGADLRTAIATQGTDLRAEMATQGTELRAEIADLRRHMGVLHEETLASIKALTPDLDALRREFKAANVDLIETIDRRSQPLEATVAYHSRVLRRHGLDDKE